MNGIHNPRLRFLGGAQTVTGSKYLLTSDSHNILVDCGLFQGLKELRLKNWDRFPIDPKTIDAIILTHAHIDHSGYIPRLIKEGFTGKVYCTQATLELCSILLPDTGHLQEEEAEYLGRRRLSKHSPPMPLFTKEDAERALEQFSAVNYGETLQINGGFKIQFRYAGHILGAASVIISVGKSTIAFSGDVGRLNDPIFRDPEPLPKVDYLVVESTYGNRIHPKSDPKSDLEKIINETVKDQGVILVPAFTVGRAQTLVHFLAELRKENRIPNIPMYLNSPMAGSVNGVFWKYNSLHKLSDDECDEMRHAVKYVTSVEESKALNLKKVPMLIVSASGMATGGRILHHLKAFAPYPRNTIILAGFQAAGTRGRQIQDGVEEIKIHREMIPVRARVCSLENLSAHADYSEILKWLESSKIEPKKVFVTHGERQSAEDMKEHISGRFHWDCEVPAQDQEFVME